MLLCWDIHKLLKGSTSHFGGEAFFKHFRNLCKIICASSWKHGIIIKASWSLPISSIVCVVSQMWRANTFWRDSKGSKHISLKGWNWLQKLDTYMDIVAKWIYPTKFKSSFWWIQSRYFHITSRAGSKYCLKGLLREQTYISQRLKSTTKIGYMSQQCYAICQKIVFHNMDFIYHPCEQITFCFANVK